jgi:hypothetical protein
MRLELGEDAVAAAPDTVGEEIDRTGYIDQRCTIF